MVYITSDLFATHAHDQPASSTNGSLTPSPLHAPGLGKRKRQQAGDDTRSHISTRESIWSQNHPAIPLHTNAGLAYTVCSAVPHGTPGERRPYKQLKRLTPKAAAPCKPASLPPVDMELAQQSTRPVVDLRSCHVCRSAPRRNRDLENYLVCRRCDQRTCYICARQCIQGCARAICNKCTVEVGQAGDPWCLDCFSRNPNV